MVYAYDDSVAWLASATPCCLAHAFTAKISGAKQTWHARYVRIIHVL